MTKPSFKSLEKLIMDIKTDLEKGQKTIVKEMMEKIDSLELLVKFLSNQVEEVCNNYEKTKN